jgi:hypothetical protein
MTEGGIDSSINDILGNALFEVARVGGMTVYVLIIERMYFIFIFNMIYGTFIYHDFQVSGIYLFTRLKDRKKWLYKSSIEVLIFAMTYTFLFLSTLLVICTYSSTYRLDGETIRMMGSLFVFITLFLTATTLIINLLAIRFNSGVGFFIVYVVLLLLTTLLLQSERLLSVDEEPYFMLLNPVAAIILNLSEDRTMRLVATVYYFLLNGIIVFVGAKFVNLLQIGLLRKDSDG